jgi:creatinine amidohydrolase
MREWNLAETNYGFVKENPFDVAVLPMGATEPHNLHLPYGTDTFQVDVMAERACESARSACANVVLLPTIPYGTETNLREFPLAINLSPSTLGTVIRDIVNSLEKSGIHKLLILNGHGGNDFKPLLRELYEQTSVHLFLCDWFRNISADVQKNLFEDPGDHAGEMETSLMLAYFADLVSLDPKSGGLNADDGTMKPTQLEAVNNKWISITRPWHLLTTNTGAGDPHLASAEKGEKLMDVLTKRLANFLVELSNEELNEQFPFGD